MWCAVSGIFLRFGVVAVVVVVSRRSRPSPLDREWERERESPARRGTVEPLLSFRSASLPNSLHVPPRFTRPPSYGIIGRLEKIVSRAGRFVRDDRAFSRSWVVSVFPGWTRANFDSVLEMGSGIGSNVPRVLHKHTAHRVMIGNERMDERAAARSGKWKRLPTRCRPLFIISARLAARSAGPPVTWRTCQIGAEFESLGLRGSRVVARSRGCSGFVVHVLDVAILRKIDSTLYKRIVRAFVRD